MSKPDPHNDLNWHQLPAEAPYGMPSLHGSLFNHVKALENDQHQIHMMNMLHAMLYSNREAMAFSWESPITSNMRPVSTSIENVVQNVVDTLVARIGTMKPKATVIPRGASFGTYTKGKLLDKYLWGQFEHLGVHALGRLVFRDSLIYGTGFLKVGIRDGEICCERVNPDEIIVDQRECVSTDKPQQVHHRRLMSRAALAALYPSKRADIEATADCKNYTSYRVPTDNNIVVIESWKLPSAPGAGDGRHAIAIEDCTLFDEAYTDECAPFVVLRWADHLDGFYGRSVVSDLIPYQSRLNTLNEVIRWGQDVMCVPRLFVEQGSQITDAKFDNQVGKIFRYRGVKPEAETWNAFNTEIYNERDRVWNRAFESQGISQLASQNKLPTQARLDSSDALRELNAINDDRFNDRVQALEEWYMEVAETIVRLSKKLYKNKSKSGLMVAYRAGNAAAMINWKDVDMDRDRYSLYIGASSVLNMTASARRDTLAEWHQRGWVTTDEVKYMSGEPDLERLSSKSAASYESVAHQIDQMLDGAAMQPDPNMDLALAMRCVLDEYLHISSFEDTEESVLQAFRNWLMTAQNLLNPPQPEMPMPMTGVPPGMDPMAAMQQPGMAPAMPGPGMAPGPVVNPGQMPMPGMPGVM